MMAGVLGCEAAPPLSPAPRPGPGILPRLTGVQPRTPRPSPRPDPPRGRLSEGGPGAGVQGASGRPPAGLSRGAPGPLPPTTTLTARRGPGQGDWRRTRRPSPGRPGADGGGLTWLPWGSLSPILSSPSGLPGRPGPRALPPDAGSSRATSSQSGWDPEPESAHASRPGHSRRGRAALRPPPPPPPPDSFPSGSRPPRSSLWASPRSPRGSAPFPRLTGFEARPEDADADADADAEAQAPSPRPAPPRQSLETRMRKSRHPAGPHSH
ncbi:basic proline-rich protein-like [Prionailurus viverrinus]|uniref:basic proline-rich protein-like n=1 Tax=Prionailurus viverrinus TaxID=61388 RepID=UPI001FF418B3|nr:basic proline-rich protein-like [Prionailurus viverrinus]